MGLKDQLLPGSLRYVMDAFFVPIVLDRASGFSVLQYYCFNRLAESYNLENLKRFRELQNLPQLCLTNGSYHAPAQAP